MLFLLALRLCAQEDPVMRFSRQLPRGEFLYVVSDGRGDFFALGRLNDPLFPASRNAAQPKLSAGSCATYVCFDAVVAKFRGSDGEMIAATFIGGTGDENPTSIALDPQGFVYISGSTTSRNLTTTEGAVQKQSASGSSPTGFVVKLTNDLTSVWFSTYLGGTGSTRVTGIAADSGGNAYVTGVTDARDFPTSGGAFRTIGGAGMAFYTKLSSRATTYMGSTLLGAGTPAGIAFDVNGDAWIAGSTAASDYPVTTGALQTRLNRAGSSDLFLTHVSSLGKQLHYSTYLGGPANDQASDIAVDTAGNVYVGGTTYSTSFPGASETLGEVGTGFVLKFSGSSVAWFRPLRANGLSSVGSLELDTQGNIVAAGTMTGTHFPTTPGAYRRCAPTGTTAGLSPFYVRIGASDGAVKYSTYMYENAGGPRWAATLPAGDVVTMSRLQTQFEQPPNVLRRYVFSAAPANRLDCVLNAASYRSAAITPGMAVTLFGAGMGPAAGVIATLEDGKVPTTLAGVRVLFNGTPAPLLFVREDQINAIVPFAIANAATAQIRVEYEGRPIGPYTINVKAADPGIFRIGSTEFGAILNQDNSLNTPENAAARGSIVTFWATGMGPFEGSYEEGSIVGSNLSPMRLPVKVTFFGAEGQVLYAGASPDMVAGITQLNVRVPANARISSRVPITLSAGDANVQDVGYISIK
jgi:uncharacterized protein (TIGR03437 family)